jgi:hypothetical protein
MLSSIELRLKRRGKVVDSTGKETTLYSSADSPGWSMELVNHHA